MKLRLNKSEVPEHLRKYFKSVGIKKKDDCMVPHRLAIALQDAGWWVRSDVVWAKGVSFCPTYSGSVMPESVTDRPAKAHEYLFLLAKSERYFFDMDAIREPQAQGTLDRFSNGAPRQAIGPKGADPDGNCGKASGSDGLLSVGRNVRSVWTINPQSFPGAHFATYPVDLVRPCIQAGTPAGGVCGACKVPFRRIVETGEELAEWKQACGADTNGEYHGTATKAYAGTGAEDASAVKARILNGMKAKRTVGWEPSCECGAPPVPATVLDIFSGSGTTGVGAVQLGRDYLGMELLPAHAALSRERIEIEGRGRRMRFGKRQAEEQGALDGLFA